MTGTPQLRWIPGRDATGPIRSTQNPLVKEMARLRQARRRRETGLILIEGPQLVAEALAAGIEVEVGFTTDPTTHPDAIEVSQAVLDRLSTTVTANTVVVVARRPEPGAWIASDVVVLWDLSEPGNLGTLIRSAAAFGFGVVVAGRESADPWSPKALRAGAGGHFHTSVRVAPDLTPADLHADGFITIAAVPGGDLPLPEAPGPRAVLVGNEAHGLPGEVIEAASVRWSVSTGPVESLNAAVAGALVMYLLSHEVG